MPFSRPESASNHSRITLCYLNALAEVPLHLARHFDWFLQEGIEATFCCEIGWGALALRMQREPSLVVAVPPTFALSLAAAGGTPAGAPYRLRVLSRRGISVCLRPWLADQSPTRADREIRLAFTGPYAPYAALFEQWLRESGREAWIPKVRTVPVAVSQLLDFMAAEEVDGFCAMEPWGLRAENEGLGRVVGSPSLGGADYPSQVLLFSRSLAQSREALEPAIDRVLARAWAWLDDGIRIRSLPDTIGGLGWSLQPEAYSRLCVRGWHLWMPPVQSCFPAPARSPLRAPRILPSRRPISVRRSQAVPRTL